MTDKLAIFERALMACERLYKAFPQAVTLKSIINQLHYLIDLDTDKTTDRSRLSEIVLGVQAAREVEPLDLDTAEILYQVAELVKTM
jgi:hypothetical protein